MRNGRKISWLRKNIKNYEFFEKSWEISRETIIYYPAADLLAAVFP